VYLLIRICNSGKLAFARDGPELDPRTRVADPDPMIFTLRSGINEKFISQILGPIHISKCLATIFWVKNT
jgi:hypothetical protein